jgi:hypothetical protein
MTIEEIEQAANALPVEQQAALARNLSAKLARKPGGKKPWELAPPDVPIEELRRIHAIIEAEFSQVDPKGS